MNEDRANQVVHTGSIASSVDLDFVHMEAHKVYHPSLPVRALYFLAFQAPFPYVANHAALEAARQRRVIADLLTYYWFGHHLVARVLDIEDVPQGHDFVTRLVPGKEPKNGPKARSFLKMLDRKFLDAGLPTWQVTRYNPHAITNFIERRDGSYRIIDLESSLVAALYPVTRLLAMAREGLIPSFDDIDVTRLRSYVAQNEADLRKKLGREYPRLLAAIDRYERAAKEWHSGEPRLINRALSWLAKRIPLGRQAA